MSSASHLRLGADGVPGLWMLVTPVLKERSYWLVRFCIHQGDDELKKQGLGKFEKVLQRSHNMWILLSDDYLTRIWCAYELATFTGTHGAEGVCLLDLKFLHGAYKILLLGIPTIIGMFGSFWLYLFFTLSIESAENPTNQYAGFVLLTLFWFALLVLVGRVLTKLKAKQFASTARNFDVRQCKATVEADIEYVLGEIGREWLTDVAKGNDGVAEFNSFVQGDMCKVFDQSYDNNLWAFVKLLTVAFATSWVLALFHAFYDTPGFRDVLIIVLLLNFLHRCIIIFIAFFPGFPRRR